MALATGRNGLAGRVSSSTAGLFVALQILAVALLAPTARAQVTAFVSPEVSGSGMVERLATDALRTPWEDAVRAMQPCVVFETGSVAGVTETTPAPAEILRTSQGTVVTLDPRDLTFGAMGQPGPMGNATGGSLPTLQAGSPKPESLFALGEPYYGDFFPADNSSRNALLFRFEPAVRAFGAWFGDVETRTEPRPNSDDGVPALLRFFDEFDVQIGPDVEVVPQPTDQALCGSPVNNSFPGCGNMTTVWLGFTDALVPVGAMLVVVGDDDTVPGQNDGNAELLSFIGATLAVPTGPTANAGADIVDCVQSRVILDGSGSMPNGCTGLLTYEWRDGLGNVVRPASVDPTFEPPTLTPGSESYTVVVTCPGAPCAGEDAVTVTLIDLPVVDAGADAAVCTAEPVLLDASATPDPGCPSGLLYEYRDRLGNVLRPFAVDPTWMAPTTTVGVETYTVAVRCAGPPSCGGTGTVRVAVQDWTVADAGPNQSVCAMAVATVDASGSLDPGCPGGLLFEWRDDLGNVVRPFTADPTWSPPTAMPGTATYTVVTSCATSPGCPSEAHVEVIVRDCPLAVRFDAYGAFRLDRSSTEVRFATAEEHGSVLFVIEARTAPGQPPSIVGTVAATGTGSRYQVVVAVPATSVRVVEYTGEGRGDATPWFGVAPTPTTGGRSRGETGAGRRRNGSIAR